MSKFAKKTEATEKPAAGKKVKLWTNDPTLQDQDTGENTSAGDKQQAKIKAKTFEKETSKVKSTPKVKSETKDAEEDKRKITLITKDNPKREGSAAFDRFELYKKHKTVAAFYEAGGSSADLRYDEKAGHIKVS